MLNEKDVSGMYSKTGRALYEKLHILRKKDEILDPSPKRRLNLNPTAEMDDLEQHFSEKIQALKAHEDEKRGIFAKENERKLPTYQSKPIKDQIEPFGMMQSRFNFRNPKDKVQGPPPGKYNPKYIQVLPRIKSVPLMTDRKNESRIKHDNASVISSMYDPISQIHNDSKAPESVDDRHAANHSHLPNISQIDSTSRSQLFFGDQAKGSYNMKKMFGRSKYNYITASQTCGSDRRFEKLDLPVNIQAENLVRFDKQLARNKKSKKKSAITTPFYNPNFEYVKERLDAGVPNFEKQSKRKNNTIEKNCLNEYELEDIERGLRLNSHIISPRFNSMQGRDK